MRTHLSLLIAPDGAVRCTLRHEVDECCLEMPAVSLLQLPCELIECILSHLSPRALSAAAATCTEMYESRAEAARMAEEREKRDHGHHTLAAGAAHTLALSWTNAQLLSWGGDPDDYNSFLSHLGHNDGRRVGSPVPTPLPVPALDASEIVAVAAGDHISATVGSDGVVHTWGRGGCRLLGRDELDGDAEMRPTPLRECTMEGPPVMYPMPTIRSVSCGPSHTLLLTEGGAVFSMGWGEYGKLGHDDVFDQLLPRHIAHWNPDPMAPIVHVAAGEAYSLAVSARGELFAWGLGEFGRLGLGAFAPHDAEGSREVHTPTLVEASCEGYAPASSSRPTTHLRSSTPAAHFVAAWAARNHSLALASSGALYSCGSGDLGMLGHGDLSDRFVLTRIEALGHVRIVSAACGVDHSIALSADGGVYTFGLGNDGALGHGVRETITRPKRVEGLAERVVEVAAGAYHSVCRGSTGVVWSFGEGRKGQLGLGTLHKSAAPQQVLSQSERALRRLRKREHVRRLLAEREKLRRAVKALEIAFQQRDDAEVTAAVTI